MAKQKQQRFVVFVCNILTILRERGRKAAEARARYSRHLLKAGDRPEKKGIGGIAQLGEHLLCKQGVRSSILLTSTSKKEVIKKK